MEWTDRNIKNETIVIPAPPNIFAVRVWIYGNKNKTYWIERVWAFKVDIYLDPPGRDLVESHVMLFPLSGQNLKDEPYISDDYSEQILYIGSKEECEEMLKKLEEETKNKKKGDING
jgi:hypothetical protein